MYRYAAVLLLALVAPGSLNGAPAAADGRPPAEPILALKGERDTELAPHGQGNVYAPDVLREGDRYRMWYGAQGRDGHDRIHYAESRDGAAWVRRGVVLADSGANHVNDPSVVKVDGIYYMYYTWAGRDVVDRIDVAVSADGMAWERKGVALAAGPPGAWDALSVGRPAVIHEGGLFRLWYDGRKDFPPGTPVKGVPKSAASHRGVGYATSRDGLHFTRQTAAPVFGNDAGGVDVKRIGGRLVMACESRDGTRFATSNDGLAWTDQGLLVAKSGTDIDAFGHVTPNLLVDADGQADWLYVGGARAATWDRNVIARFRIPPSRIQRVLGPNAGSASR
jgi:hypothetical protein